MDGDNRRPGTGGDPAPDAPVERVAVTAPDWGAPPYPGRVRDAVEHAYRLLVFLSDHGRHPEAETTRAIIEAAHKVGGPGWTAEVEIRFWAAHAAVCAKAAPTTIETMEFSTDHQGVHLSRILWLVTVALMFLIGVMHFQLATLDNIGASVDRLTVQIEDAEQRIETAAQALTATQMTAPDDLTALFNREAELSAMERELDGLQAALGSQYDILSDLWIIAGTGLFDGGQRFEDEDRRRRYLFAHGDTLRRVIASFTLPGVYGMLGAMAFILRRHQEMARALAVSPRDGAANLIRFVLGALAGAAIGLFMRPDQAGTGDFAPLTPLALAFLAGYAVELLFVGMDRIVGAFVGQPRRDGA
jgi:hypothetical protein